MTLRRSRWLEGDLRLVKGSEASPKIYIYSKILIYLYNYIYIYIQLVYIYIYIHSLSI